MSPTDPAPARKSSCNTVECKFMVMYKEHVEIIAYFPKTSFWRGHIMAPGLRGLKTRWVSH